MSAPALDPAVSQAARTAMKRVPPLWPLSATVAVNPFLGHAKDDLAAASARLARVAGVRATMPRRWYAEKIDSGEIGGEDLRKALDAGARRRRIAVDDLVTAARRDRPAPVRLPNAADLAVAASDTDWPAIVTERIGHFAAAYFDEGQALWVAPQGDLWRAWRDQAQHDLTPEIMGLTGFAAYVAALPPSADDALAAVVGDLSIPDAVLPDYFHGLLTGLGGWGQLARGRGFVAEREGGEDATLFGLLVVRLAWEAALLRRFGDAFGAEWSDAIARWSEATQPSEDDLVDAVLQDALDRATQRRLAASLAAPEPPSASARPTLQAAFCIDVRSEVYRRALERVSGEVATLGFAGFFGLATAHRCFASDVVEARLPVLLNPALRSTSGTPADAASDLSARFIARAKRAWGRFKMAAVSSFAFVEAMGPVYVSRLVRDAFHLERPRAMGGPAPRFEPSPDLAERVTAAAGVLCAMSLTADFARVVLIAGHGASVTNNPHASALQCGACGGHAGDVNARLLASLLNDPDVRRGLATRGIDVPADTTFVAALHDTTTDTVTLYDTAAAEKTHGAELARIRTWLDAASVAARNERVPALPGATSTRDVFARARDWAQTRPEWGLAGCSAFVAAPRRRTAAQVLRGRAFLHDYDWRRDDGFGILELILTAPLVVASWISLQYYGSVVAPELFGAGNKVLHNVTGGIGVVEGNGGNLRGGLALQSVHDGERFVHEPVRLSVLVEAPREAIGEVLAKHPDVDTLFSSGWLHLFALDDAGQIAWRYDGALTWSAFQTDDRRRPTRKAA